MNTASHSAHPPSPSPSPGEEHTSNRSLGGAERQLLVTHLVAVVAVSVLVILLGRGLGNRVAGPFTLGMALLGLQVLTVLVAAVRYERHSAARIDRPPVASRRVGTDSPHDLRVPYTRRNG